MKIEHTRVSQDGHQKVTSPQKITYWSIAHNGKQYQIQQETDSSGRPREYQYYVDRATCIKVSSDLSAVSASLASFVDITLAVMLAKFVKEEAA